MVLQRREFIRYLASFVPFFAGLLRSSPVLSDGRWVARRATASDTEALATVFNSHLDAGTCPYAELSTAWTPSRARAFLKLYQATVVLERDKTPVGFVGLIDYTDPSASARIAPGADTDVPVVALDIDHLGSDAVVAAKHLAAAAARELRRQNIPGCRLMISPQPMLASQDWFERHMSIERELSADGVTKALEIRVDAVAGLRDLEAAGY